MIEYKTEIKQEIFEYMKNSLTPTECIDFFCKRIMQMAYTNSFTCNDG